MAKRVLVVEDDAAIGELVAMVLRNEGYEVTLVRDCKLVLESVAHTTPDLVLIDSPDARGYGPAWDLALALHRKDSSIPLMMFTGHIRDALEVGVTERGKVFVGAITKPFDIDTLLAEVEMVTRREMYRLPHTIPHLWSDCPQLA